MKSTLVIVALLIASCSGCAAVQKGAPAFAACEAGVISQVAALIAENAATLEADLTSLGLKFGVGTVTCAIQAVAAVKAAPTAAPKTSEEANGLARAQKWAAGK